MKTSSCRVSLLLLAMITITPQASYSNLKDIQIYQLMNELEQEYLYCGKDRSKLSDLINEVSRFDEDRNSPLWLLRTHIDLGYSIAKADSILDVLEYVEEKLDHIYRNVDAQQAEAMYATFYSVMHDIKNGMLNVDEQFIAEDQTRDCGGVDSDTIKVRQKLYVLRSAKFFKDVEFKDDATFEGDLSVDGDISVGGTLSVVGTLSVENQNVGGVPFISNAGIQNSFVGANAGNPSMSGTSNSGFGFNALISNAAGSSNTALGSQALAANISGGGNTAVGTNASLQNTTGTFNTALGAGALQANTTGITNTAIGFGSLASNIGGIQNTAVGFGSMGSNLTGGANLALGLGAGSALVSGSNNIYILNVGGGAAESNTIRIGTSGTQTAAYMQGIFGAAVAVGGLPVEVDAVGKLGTVISSAEFKKNIQDMDLQSEKLRRLRPVQFQYKNDDSNTLQIGLIAEEVAQVFPELVVYDLESKPYSVRYQVLPVLLLQELQKHQDSIEMLIERVSQLEEVVGIPADRALGLPIALPDLSGASLAPVLAEIPVVAPVLATVEGVASTVLSTVEDVLPLVLPSAAPALPAA